MIHQVVLKLEYYDICYEKVEEDEGIVIQTVIVSFEENSIASYWSPLIGVTKDLIE